MKNSCASRELSVGELARRAGVAVSALHFYETKGLISSQRNAGNQRRFSRETLRDQLDGCIGCGCLSLQACPLRNPGDQLSAEGPGAHWLDAEGREHDG